MSDHNVSSQVEQGQVENPQAAGEVTQPQVEQGQVEGEAAKPEEATPPVKPEEAAQVRMLGGVNVAGMTPAQIIMVAGEAELTVKWGHKLKTSGSTIVPCSTVQEPAHHHFGNKRRVRIKCGCGLIEERATSDVHTWIGCSACKKDVRKANKAMKKIGAGSGDVEAALAAAHARLAELEAQLAGHNG